MQEQIVLSPIAHQLRYRSSTAASSMCEDSRGTQRNQRSQALALLQVVAAARRTGRWYVRAPDRNEGETPLPRRRGAAAVKYFSIKSYYTYGIQAC